MPGVETEPRIAPRVNKAEPQLAPAAGENRVVIRDVGWQGYEALLALIGDQPVRITYDRGDVELMSPLLKHERNRSQLAQLVKILAEELEIPLLSAGATTLKRKDLDQGLEADASFYFGDLSRIANPDDLRLGMDPPPDLAIEIEITRSVLSRLGVYGRLGVPEVWRFDGSKLRILELLADGTYRERTASRVLPWITIEEIHRFVVTETDLDESRWSRTFRHWVRETVVPRIQAERGGDSGSTLLPDS